MLGLWIVQIEGAKFWMRIMSDLQARVVADILIAVVDGLKGFPDAITSVFTETTVQICIVHLQRHSLQYVTWKDRKQVAAALRAMYRAPIVEAADPTVRLDHFATTVQPPNRPTVQPSTVQPSYLPMSPREPFRRHVNWTTTPNATMEHQ